MYNEPEDTLEPGGQELTWAVMLGEAHKHVGTVCAPLRAENRHAESLGCADVSQGQWEIATCASVEDENET